MKDIQLTNYQLISYYLPGQLFVFCFFITYQQVNSIDKLITSLKDLNIAFGVVSIIFSFLIGLIFDAIRNGFIEKIFKLIEKKKPKTDKINWDFFYTGDIKDVGVFYGRYFTYYCFDFNLIISLFISIIMLDSCGSLKYKLIFTLVSIGSIISLLSDGLVLRSDMAKATNYKNPKP